MSRLPKEDSSPSVSTRVSGHPAGSIASAATNVALSEEERAVLQAIRATSYGAVEIVLHQSRIVQIVKTEKVRVDGTAVSI
jgi:hypothetical protein